MARQTIPSPAYQRRFQRAPKLSVRQQESGELVVGGYSIVFDSPSVMIWDYFEESVDPEIRIDYADDDVFSLFNHNWDHVLGRLGAGTYSIDRRDEGMYSETTLADNEWNRSLAQSIERGDIAGQSFGFDILAEEWNTAGKHPKSILKHIRLYETTITPIPAYPATDIDVQARARLEAFEQERAEQGERELSMLRLEWARRKMRTIRRA